jgi:TolB-like protein/DNA-binding winged helix-turn-helix (wHTH) protein/lipopolysaccharide biosynthesis regulator YciM
MNKLTNLAERVRFGTFELNVRTGELASVGTAAVEAGAAKVQLRQQPFQILRILVERQGKIVTREEIRQILWPDDTVVEFDRSINVAMAILRKALADDADHPNYIETLVGRGYRLIALVEWQQSSTAAQDLLEPRADTLPRIEGQISEREPRAARHWRKTAILGSSAVILIVVGYLSWRHFRAITPPKSEKIMLAVLPFENLTGDPNKEYLADGLTEETISQLGRLNPEQLGVIARTSVMGYKHKSERLDQIGRDLSVQYVLENSLRGSGDHVRITTQLLQVKDQSHLWSQDYDYSAKDILKVEDDVAKAVARETQLHLSSQQKAELAQSRPVKPEAFEAYLQGYYFFERDTDKDTEMAAKYYERATQLDPSYALAWAGLSRVRKWQAKTSLIPTEQGYRLAREEVQRALALDPNLAQAHIQLGRIQQQVDFDWTGADASYQRAVELEPGNPESVGQAASSAAFLGHFDRALLLSRRTIDLDPLNATSWVRLGQIECWSGQLDAAIPDLKKALDLNRNLWSAHISLSQIYIMQGRPQDALPEIELIRYDLWRAVQHAVAYYALGRQKEADAALSELIARYHARSAHAHSAYSAYGIAQVYAFRKQSDEAFQWLDRAYAEHDDGLIMTKVDPLLKNLHNDPRYTALLKKLNLPN